MNMDPLAAAFWGGFFTVAAFMLLVAVGAAATGLTRMATVAATYSLVPALFIYAYLGLLPLRDPAAHARFLAHLNVLGTVGLASQLLLVLRGYTKQVADQRLRLALLATGCGVLAVSWLLTPQSAFWLSLACAAAMASWLIVLALVKAIRGNRSAWISVAGVTLALVSLLSVSWLFAAGGVAPVAVHAVAATSSIAYVAIMGWALWTRYAYALELRQVLAQGPSFDPVTRLPSYAHAGKLVGSFLRSGSSQPLGVLVVSLANLALLEQLHGRAAYNHALYVSAGRLRRSVPVGTQLGRVGDDGFLVLVRTHDPELLKHTGAKIRRLLTQPIRLGAELDSQANALHGEWTAEVGIGMTMRNEPESAGHAVATARALSRTALALTSRIVYSEGLNAPLQEVPS
jgi:GGDEF domain-containing protein